MKGLLKLFIILLLIGITNEMSADTYKILRLNTPTITIGGKQLKIGDTFNGTSQIKWNDSKQAMEVRNVETGALYKFSEKVFTTKGVAASIADFFLRTSQGSSRDNVTGNVLKKSSVSANFPEKRIALVIGNSNYENLSYLRNAQKDATDVADALSSLGFDVIEVYEANYQDMMTGLNKFASQAKNYDVALFYYAGHGTQYEGKNYLLPINFENNRKSELEKTLHADDVLQRIEDSGAPVQLIFIDACRNVPTTWTRDSSQGLARMEGGRGSVIVFSTESGKTADDGDGDNSPFAASLINNMSKPVSFDETINGVAKDTYELTEHKQFPLRVGMLLNDFRFNPAGVDLAKVEVPRRQTTNEKTVASTSRPLSPSQRFEKEHPNAHYNRPVVEISPQGFKATCDLREIGVRVGEVYRSGSNLIVELILTDKAGKPLNLNTIYGSTERVATTVNGDMVSWGNIRCKLGPYENADLGFKIVPNVPLKLQVSIEGLTSPEQLAYLNVNFYLRDVGDGNFTVTRE